MSLDRGDYDDSFKFVELSARSLVENPATGELDNPRVLANEDFIGKTVNVVVGPTGCGKTSMIRIVAGGDVEPPKKASSTKNSTGYIVNVKDFGELIFWDAPGIMDTDNDEPAQRQMLLQNLTSAIRKAQVKIGAFIVLVDGCIARLPGEYYEWITALMSIMPPEANKRILVTKVNGKRHIERYKKEVAANNPENCAVCLKNTGQFQSIQYIGEETPEITELDNMFQRSTDAGVSSDKVSAPIHPDAADEMIAKLSEKLQMLQDCKSTEEQIHALEVTLAGDKKYAEAKDHAWNRFWWAGWVQELHDTAARTEKALQGLKANKGDKDECNRIVWEYKEEVKRYARRMEDSLGFLDILVAGAKKAADAPPVPAAGERKRAEWRNALSALKKFFD